MVWRRLPTYLPSFPLRLLPLSASQKKVYEATGHVAEVVFKTLPSVGKVRGRGRREGKNAGGGFVYFSSPTDQPLPCSFSHLQLELKEYLTKVYNLPVASLRTSVLAGKKKRGKHGHYARSDVKKAYVSLKPPSGA